MNRLITLLALAAFATCDSGPKEGELVLALASPNPQDGAVSFTVTSTEPEAVLGVSAACSGCQVFSYRVSETRMRGIVTGAIPQGPMVRVLVSNIKDPESYAASVQAAAAPTFAVRAVGGYLLTVEKP